MRRKRDEFSSMIIGLCAALALLRTSLPPRVARRLTSTMSSTMQTTMGPIASSVSRLLRSPDVKHIARQNVLACHRLAVDRKGGVRPFFRILRRDAAPPLLERVGIENAKPRRGDRIHPRSRRSEFFPRRNLQRVSRTLALRTLDQPATEVAEALELVGVPVLQRVVDDRTERLVDDAGNRKDGEKTRIFRLAGQNRAQRRRGDADFLRPPTKP